MAARTASKGILPVLAADAPDFEVQFEELVRRRERGVGEFNRTIVLPDKVDPERIKASFADGVLTVRLPKSEAAKPRQIEIT